MGLGRAQGRRNTARPADVPPEVTADSPQGRDIGASDRVLGSQSPIPGGEQHIVNHQTMRQRPAVAAPKPEFRGVMAHGVPPGTHSAHERADAMRGPNSTHDVAPAPHESPRRLIDVPPVPVTIVQEDSDLRPLRSTSHRRYLVPATGSQPIQLVGRNSHRIEVMMLNEDATHHIRFAQSISELNGPSTGSVLPSTTSSYLKIKTQDVLFAVSDDSGTPYMSIIEVFDRPQSEAP